MRIPPGEEGDDRRTNGAMVINGCMVGGWHGMLKHRYPAISTQSQNATLAGGRSGAELFRLAHNLLVASCIQHLYFISAEM
jgi:hypothetical protein